MKKFIAGAASLMLCMGLHAQDFRINPSGYFENGGANVMVFSDVYPVRGKKRCVSKFGRSENI